MWTKPEPSFTCNQKSKLTKEDYENTIYLFLPHDIFSIFCRTSEESWNKSVTCAAYTAICNIVNAFSKLAHEIFTIYA